MAETDDEAPRGPEAAAGGGAVRFDEEIYLRLNPDVRLAVSAGSFRSGQEHYERYGRQEGRPFQMTATGPRNRVMVNPGLDLAQDKGKAAACAVDGIKISSSGAIFVIGWVNDAVDRLEGIDLFFAGWSISLTAASLARVRRPDAEAALALGPRHAHGFWGFVFAARRLHGGICSAVIRHKSGAEASLMLTAETVEDDEMRDVVLTHLATVHYLGNPYFEAVASIDHTIGAQLVDLNKMLSRRAVNGPYVERFGRADRTYKGSFVVCLYGKLEYMFLQNAIFARQPSMRDYEFIYVSNSPHIAEQLLKEAKLCALIYGIDMTVIVLNANAGFGAANNIAADYAKSDRLIIMNPDVFPHDDAWTDKHSALLEALPAEQTELFGAPLYYDDGSLMHAGMYFDLDTMPSFGRGRIQEASILRVEHYGKGAPPETKRFLRPRPVPAVTGAFMSITKDWFETLDGFTPDYVYGHYEDADLCLKSIEEGRPPWLHDLRLWHLEGKGSTRRPEHEGGSIVNRWLFTRNWGEFVSEGLLGPEPGLAAFAELAAPVVEPVPAAKPAPRPGGAKAGRA